MTADHAKSRLMSNIYSKFLYKPTYEEKKSHAIILKIPTKMPIIHLFTTMPTYKHTYNTHSIKKNSYHFSPSQTKQKFITSSIIMPKHITI